MALPLRGHLVPDTQAMAGVVSGPNGLDSNLTQMTWEHTAAAVAGSLPDWELPAIGDLWPVHGHVAQAAEDSRGHITAQ